MTTTLILLIVHAVISTAVSSVLVFVLWRLPKMIYSHRDDLGDALLQTYKKLYEMEQRLTGPKKDV